MDIFIASGFIKDLIGYEPFGEPMDKVLADMLGTIAKNELDRCREFARQRVEVDAKVADLEKRLAKLERGRILGG